MSLSSSVGDSLRPLSDTDTGSRIITAHGDNEYILKSDLVEAVAGYKKLIKESLWPTKRVPSVIVEEVVSEEIVAPVSSSATVVDEDKETEAAKPEVVEPHIILGSEEL